jgi:hypothetical protein
MTESLDDVSTDLDMIVRELRESARRLEELAPIAHRLPSIHSRDMEIGRQQAIENVRTVRALVVRVLALTRDTLTEASERRAGNGLATRNREDTDDEGQEQMVLNMDQSAGQ